MSKSDKLAPVVSKRMLHYATLATIGLRDQAMPLLPEGVRVEDRRPIPEMTDRPALLLLAVCPECSVPFIFITSEPDTCNYSTTCKRCMKSHT